MDPLLRQIRACTHCQSHLPLPPRPVLAFTAEARILIAGQAPGRRAHAAGIPWSDASGERLRDWLGVRADEFYDPTIFAVVPMGFCYPGTGKSGDLPPRPECAELWFDAVQARLKKLELKVVIGSFAQAKHLDSLGLARGDTLTETVRAWRDYQPHIVPLPHPSPRNNLWLRKNPWFEHELLPVLKSQVRAIIDGR